MEAVVPYGTIYEESTWGSGGGSYLTNGNNGGRGGGFAHLYVRDTVTITGNGRILANALNSAVSYCLAFGEKKKKKNSQLTF